MKNSDYWVNRMLILEESLQNKGYEFVQNLETQFEAATRQVEKELSSWYQRLAANNDISLTEARKLLTANELKEFHWTVQEYIKYGKQNSLIGQWIKELENASARVHISRLDSLKIQLQQQAEVLYGNQLDGLDKLARNNYTEGYYHTAFEIQKGVGVGWSLQGVNEDTLTKVLSRPWTTDGQTFSNRIWTNKEHLVNTVNTQLTQMIMRGEAPDKAVKAISHQMNVSKSKAGRLVMTESAAFSSAARQDCFNALDVEKYIIIATLDLETSDICRDLDGKVFKMSEFEVGVTANPFHPWCRTTTAPYFDDMATERIARGEDGKTYKVPGDMTYKDWHKQFVNKSVQNNPIRDIIDNNWVGLAHSSNYTKQEAIDRLQKEHGIEFIDSRPYPMNGELLNNCVGWTDSFSNQYGTFMKNNPCKLPRIENKARLGNAVGKYTYYERGPGVVGISLNGKYHSDINFFEEYVGRAISTKWTVPNAATHKTFIHEFGHHISNSMRWVTNNVNWESDFIADCIKDLQKSNTAFTGTSYRNMADIVSRYASTDESELFAETFAEYFGGENPREFARIFGARLDKILRGVK